MATAAPARLPPRSLPTDDLAALFRAPIERRGATELRQLAQVKRLLERCRGDGDFVRELIADLDGAPAIAARHGIALDPRDALPLFAPERADLPRALWSARWPLARLWQDYLDEWEATRRGLPDSGACPDANPRFDAWRRRQMRRCDGELGREGDAIAHAIIAFELSAGCTMGCWFCGVSAERFRGHLAYTDQNARLWRDVLDEASALFGPGMRSGFCYWATDPADNPDYPRFLDDYFQVTGTLPQTTTAAPLRDLALTRQVLAMHDRHGYRRNRFSILNRKTLERVHAAFTADELLEVDLILQTPGGTTPRALAGRARTHRPATFAAAEESRTSPTATIACVTGFLVNMVDRTVRLVSPTPPGDRWPLGFRTFDTGHFTTPADFRRVLQGMIDRHMPSAPRGHDVLRFRDDLRYEPVDDGFALSACGARFTFKGQAGTSILGGLIRRGDASAGDIRDALAEAGVSLPVAARLLQDVYDRGLLAEPSVDGRGDGPA